VEVGGALVIDIRALVIDASYLYDSVIMVMLALIIDGVMIVNTSDTNLISPLNPEILFSNDHQYQKEFQELAFISRLFSHTLAFT